MIILSFVGQKSIRLFIFLQKYTNKTYAAPLFLLKDVKYTYILCKTAYIISMRQQMRPFRLQKCR